MFTRYRNLTVLGVAILAQLLLLAYQVRRPDAGGVRLLRLWTIRAVVPVARTTHLAVARSRGLLRNYALLRGARQQAETLRAQLAAAQLANMQLRAAAQPVARLDALLGFKVPVIRATLPAQIIGGSASEDSQVLYLNRGSEAGLARNMPVLTPDGVVGKVTQVFPGAAEVLLLTDPDSGVGAMLEPGRLHGVLWGMGPGSAQLRFVAANEKVSAGAEVVTSGEDQIFPPGLPLGIVTTVEQHAPFLVIDVRPRVDAARLEDVLVATRIVAEPAPAAVAGLSAAQIHDKLLPSIPTEVFNPPTGPPPLISDLLAARRRATNPTAAPVVAAPKPAAAAPNTASHAAPPAAVPAVKKPPKLAVGTDPARLPHH